MPAPALRALVPTLAMILLPVLGACGEGGTDGASSSEDTGGAAVGAPGTYYANIKPILDHKCVHCHREGEVAPFALDTWAAVQPRLPQIASAVDSGRMPPWPPDPGCRQYRDERRMTPAEKTALVAFAAGDAPVEGNPSDATPFELVTDDLEDANFVARIPEPYTPSTERPDDYRCFLLDAEFEEDVYMMTNTVVPGLRNLVHHVLLYRVSPGQLPTIEELDAADPGQGYTCFGGPGVPQDNPLAGWAPGDRPIPANGVVGQRIAAGTRIVMQLHYSTGDGRTGADQTEFRAVIQAEKPELIVRTQALPYLDIRIPAGNPASVQVKEFTNSTTEPWVVLATVPHMHVLGTEIRLDAVHADGSEECLVDIPNWDFNWQQPYVFREDEEVQVQPGDKLRLTCTYDNSSANQAVVNGERLEPRDVFWGEGTTDEMCLAYIMRVTPN